MTSHIVIYQLRQKFVNRREDIPEDARQVIYYSLAVGHHVGVLDCFSNLAEIPLDIFQSWLANLPEGPGRDKLEGVIKWGEIEINRSHVAMLLPLLDGKGTAAQDPDSGEYEKQPSTSIPEAARVEPEPDSVEWQSLLKQCLHGMLQEPAFYLMLRKYT